MIPENELPQLHGNLTTGRTGYKVVRFLLLIKIFFIVSFSSVVMVAMQPASRDRVALDQIVRIPQGTTGYQIANLLYEEGIIKDSTLFRLVLRLTRAGNHLQAGDYLLNPSMTPFEVVDQLKAGNVVAQRVVIPEGFELKQIAAALARDGLVDEQRFLVLARDASLVYGEDVPLDLPIKSLEGYLFPDTYRFVQGQTEEAIIRQMVARFLEVVPRAVEPYLAKSSFNLHEIVTLASIVEKEIMVDRERAIVAGVYLNRLAINMPLQADPTVRYVMEEERSRVLYRDLEIESPYNTYRNRGLPPGPIASPGLASVRAVLNPADVEYLFFVSRRDGTHQFSRTFNEHVQARRALGY